MSVIDLHCDTIWRLMDLGGKGDLLENDGAVSIRKMQAGEVAVQFFACFLYRDAMEGRTEEEKYENGYFHVLDMIRYGKEQMETYGKEIVPITGKEELGDFRTGKKCGAVLTVEDGGILNGKIERLEELWDRGIRLLTLTWNYENCIGFPNSNEKDRMEKGLKAFGKEVVERMNELGMLVDLSHASDGTFWDVLNQSKKPVTASHSNCRALANHPRNLSDEMLRALGENGGIAGLNFYGPFLGTPKESRIEEMTAHIRHMIDKGGEDLPCLGTDFDGFDGMDKMDLPDQSFLGQLWDALKGVGLTERQIEKICFENVWRVWKER